MSPKQGFNLFYFIFEFIKKLIELVFGKLFAFFTFPDVSVWAMESIDWLISVVEIPLGFVSWIYGHNGWNYLITVMIAYNLFRYSYPVFMFIVKKIPVVKDYFRK